MGGCGTEEQGRDREADTGGGARVEIAQVPLEDQRRQRVAERNEQHRGRPEQKAGAAAETGTDERDDAEQAGCEAAEAAAAHPLGCVKTEREHSDEERCGRDQDRCERGRDLTLAHCEQRKRQSDLGQRVQAEPAQPSHTDPSTPARRARASSTSAPIEVRVSASNAGVTPPASATLINQ
jgi:hypothetical protein